MKSLHRKLLKTPHPFKQKFHHGDHVLIAKDLGSCMSHFTAGCEAIVIGSYEDQYGGKCYRDGNPISYTLLLPHGGTSSWYHEPQLTLIKKNRQDLIKLWKDRDEADIAKKSDLDWIFNNSEIVLKKGYAVSIAALAATVGFTNMWGNRGEGIDLAENQARLIYFAFPYLEKKDKTGWLDFVEKMKPRLVVEGHRGLLNFIDTDKVAA